MDPRIFTERLRGIIAGYFLSLMLVFLIPLAVESQYLLSRTVEWTSVLYFTETFGFTVLTGFIGYWIFCKKPFADAIAIVYFILTMIIEGLGYSGHGIAPGAHARALPAIAYLGQLSNFVMIGFLFWLKKRDKTDELE